MSVKFEWDDKYSVGEERLDNQHKYLFQLSNKIQDADKSEGKHYVMELFKYTKIHFGEEEDHLKDIGFTDLVRHMELHNKLITDLSTMVERYSGTQENIDDLAVFLYKWLTDHILTKDMKYAAFSGY